MTKAQKINTEVLCAKNQADLRRAAQILKDGGIVALPTETVYGLAANAFNQAAIEQIFNAKNRPLNNPLIHHIEHLAQAQSLLNTNMQQALFQNRLNLLAHCFWPGPLTIVAEKSDKINSLSSANLSTVALRVPKSEATLKILSMLDFPLVMPSANLSLRPSPTTSAHVLKTLNHRIHAVVDGGKCGVGIESTVISIHEKQPKILRHGSIAKLDLELCLNEEVLQNIDQNQDYPSSPGQGHLHYSPKVNSISLIDLENMQKFWHGKNQIIGRECDINQLIKTYGNIPLYRLITLSNSPEEYAQNLYEAFYKTELKQDLDLIIISPPKSDEKWLAVNDRLARASGNRAE